METETDRTHTGGKIFLRLGLGFGGGFVRNTYTNPIAAQENFVGYSSNVDILLGMAVANGIILGGGISFFVIPDGTYSETPYHKSVTGFNNLLSAVGFANIYLDRKGGFQLMLFGGVGELATSVRTSYAETDSRGNIRDLESLDSTKTAGLAGIGLGWDAYVSRRWSLGLMAKAMGFIASGKMNEMEWRFFSTTSVGIMPTLGITATYN